MVMNVLTHTLSNGVVLPPIGFGSYRLSGRGAIAKVVADAISMGYRLIDTAACYQNEDGVGDAVRTCGIPREELLVTSKVWNTDRGYDKTMVAFETSLKLLGMEYLDLYLIHWPANAVYSQNWESVNRSTWFALIELYKKQKVRAIGVSNFKPKHLEALMTMDVQPMVNQIEIHPGFLQKETLEYCCNHGIVVEGWAPFGNGALLQEPLLIEIAKKYSCSTAQVCLGWAVQHGVIPLPKSSHIERMKQNLLPRKLEDEDMLRLDALPPCGGSCHDSDTVNFI